MAIADTAMDPSIDSAFKLPSETCLSPFEESPEGCSCGDQPMECSNTPMKWSRDST